MNPTLIEIIACLIAVFIGLILLLVGVRMAVKETKKEVETDEQRERRERLNFLRKYSIQLESMRTQHTIGEEQYKQELAYLDRALQEIENE